ncbi:Serine/threonine-protein kinase AfsK [Polystyrenella longa]|uniref:Serine/threonine-protein kinase AfsK n=1 Tax=Polystyrenella longa TaxID=2528007 RepID=A0A518CI81_9PLAN|nr:PQQ-binding-like beta-propeller repeat protein [Polystyrenella longa]QDU78907.1 Serine/threonine-protein kinase AfsK [Polystyrenella longa]
MRVTRLTGKLLLALGCFGLFVLAPLRAEELKVAAPTPTSWPSFRNGNLQQGVAGSPLPEELEELWKIDVPDGVVATVAIVGEYVYLPALNGHLICLNLNDGSEVWRYRSLESEDPDEFAPGFRATPQVTEKMVYLGDEDGILHAVDRATGKLVWKYATGDEISGCVAIYNGKVIVGSYDSYLYCLNAKTGAEDWSFETGDRINGSPGVVENFTFVAGCDHHLRVIDIDAGTQKADIPLETYLIASPAIWKDELYVGTQAGEVVAVNWKTEEITWRYTAPSRKMPIHSSAAVTEKHVFVGGHDKLLHAIDRSNGEGLWTFPTRAGIESSPVVVEDRVFFGSRDRNLYGVSVETGKEVFKANLGKSIIAGPAVGENCLVIGTEGSNGTLHCFGSK